MRSKMEMLKKLTISLSVNSLLCLLFLFTSGCACFRSPNVKITEFPPSPKYKEVSENPVVDFDENTKNYTITDSTMHNFLMNKVFLEEILKWRRENNIR